MSRATTATGSAPIPADLDQAVITAGLELVRAELAPERDEPAIADAEAAYRASMQARWATSA